MDVIKALAHHERVSEKDFDLLFPTLLRKLSRTHWTPLTAALRAAELLVQGPGDKILDIGSGAGKLCIVGALTTRGAFTGVEKDEDLVRAARNIAREQKIERVRFIHGDAFQLDWGTFQALYLFNPFANDIAITKDSLRNVPMKEDLYIRLISQATAKFAILPPGVRIVTYHGFGGTMPPNLIEQSSEIIGPGVLQLWHSV